MRSYASPERRFWSRVQIQPGGCATWHKPMPNGYGYFTVKGKSYLAHRFSYESVHGPIPSGLEIDHVCRVRHCVNPAHLEPVDHLTNVRRGLAGDLKTHCKRGHPLTLDNLEARALERGRRVCVACRHRGRRQARERRHVPAAHSQQAAE